MSHNGVAELPTSRDYSHIGTVNPYFSYRKVTFLEDLGVSLKYSKSLTMNREKSEILIFSHLPTDREAVDTATAFQGIPTLSYNLN